MFLEFRHQNKYYRPTFAIMQRAALLLLAISALASALPRNKSLVGRDEGSAETTVSSISTNTTTTEKPENKVITVKDSEELSTKVSEAGDKLVVVFIMGNSCPLSQRIAPTVDQIAKENTNVVVLKVDVFDPTTIYFDIADDYDLYIKRGDHEIIPLPTFVFVKGGNKVGLVRRPRPGVLRSTVAGYV